MMSRLPSSKTLVVLSLGAFLGIAMSFGLAERNSGAASPSAVAQGADAPAIKGWQKGKGWGWIWGKDDEVGALNGLTAESRAGNSAVLPE